MRVSELVYPSIIYAPLYPCLLCLTTVKLLCDVYKLLSYLLCTFPYSPVTATCMAIFS